MAGLPVGNLIVGIRGYLVEKNAINECYIERERERESNFRARNATSDTFPQIFYSAFAAAPLPRSRRPPCGRRGGTSGSLPMKTSRHPTSPRAAHTRAIRRLIQHGDVKAAIRRLAFLPVKPTAPGNQDLPITS
jgi:hypothetical protein